MIERQEAVEAIFLVHIHGDLHHIPRDQPTCVADDGGFGEACRAGGENVKGRVACYQAFTPSCRWIFG